MRRARELLVALALLTLLVAQPAHATPPVSFRVAFAPFKLGHGTNVAFSLHIHAPPGHRAPEPLTAVDIRFPAQLGVALSGLGIDTCPQHTLEIYGPKYCPADSRMGSGTAIAVLPLGSENIPETATITILAAPEENEHIAIVFYAEAHTPLLNEISIPAVLLPTPTPYETIHIDVPILESWAAGPDIAITTLSADIGPRGLTYYEPHHGKRIPYKPKGILLPNQCPTHGFRFQATLTFAGGPVASADATIPCPHARSHHG